ncbi:hypothetical protein QTO34_001435 [Cnephaeus nilssonii]|uniref:Interleukin-17A n=1 Tax=Cnephaeus nilssonii TaxID=3371016 RepID=A0AA40HW03_CNENI|nr:hypothetical protein QTO34_001435 [Eptesicus nilssonii]
MELLTKMVSPRHANVIPVTATLLSLVAIVKAAVVIPRNPECPNTEDKNFPQSVRVNLNILNRDANSRRPSDYYNRSTSPWNLQYQEILVLRREPRRCPHSFRLEKILVTVGCTCVTPIVHHVA